MSVQEAVDDIIARGTVELRKSAFGDDAEDAKSIPWSREQAWVLMKQLAKKTEVCRVSSNNFCVDSEYLPPPDFLLRNPVGFPVQRRRISSARNGARGAYSYHHNER